MQLSGYLHLWKSSNKKSGVYIRFIPLTKMQFNETTISIHPPEKVWIISTVFLSPVWPGKKNLGVDTSSLPFSAGLEGDRLGLLLKGCNLDVLQDTGVAILCNHLRLKIGNIPIHGHCSGDKDDTLIHHQVFGQSYFQTDPQLPRKQWMFIAPCGLIPDNPGPNASLACSEYGISILDIYWSIVSLCFTSPEHKMVIGGSPQKTDWTSKSVSNIIKSLIGLSATPTPSNVGKKNYLCTGGMKMQTL